MYRGDWAKHPLLTGEPAVVCAKTLERLGVPRRTINKRCGPGGPWRRVLPGIYLLGRAAPTAHHRLRAALLRGREGAVVTGLWALRLHGLQRIPDVPEIHVLVPNERRVASEAFVLIERTRRVPLPLIRQDIAVAPIPRAIADAARRLTDHDTIQAMMAEAIQRRRCTAQAIAGELIGEGHPGLPLRALTPLLAGAESVAEADAWRLWQRSGLPACQWNVTVLDADGHFIARPDAWCDEVAFAWEIDSRAYHSEGADFGKTLARNARYAASGIVVLQTLPARLRTKPDEVIAELRAAYAAALARPRPVVVRRN